MTPPAAPSPVWHNLFRRRPPWAEEVAGLWAATPLFEGIPRREVLRLARDMHPRSFEEDEVVFRAGDVGAGAVLVLEGRVEIRVGAA
ncbi:cyclic nucleotide-binding domain-containing protein, partial [Dissulfurirhabdus thermomarina]